MKKYLMNKNVEHDGTAYAKGSEVKGEVAKLFAEMGHAQEFSFSEGEEAPAEQVPEGSEDQSAEQEKPVKKSRK